MKVRRIYREDREASITPKLLHNLIVVAASRGFFLAQQTIRRDRISPPMKVELPPGETYANVTNKTPRVITVIDEKRTDAT